jgi:Family of unknown function (DUF6518)
VVWVVLLGLLFGAADQFVGTTHVIVHAGGWTTTVSNLSAPWLIVPFLAGWSQGTLRRAAIGGAVSLLAAFSGYWLLTLSPVEGVSGSQAVAGIVPLVEGHAPWLLGGAIGGPVFGVLGHHWRTRRAWTSVAAVSLLLFLEPLAWFAAGLGARFSDARPVWLAEATAGACAAIAMLAVRRRAVSR